MSLGPQNAVYSPLGFQSLRRAGQVKRNRYVLHDPARGRRYLGRRK